MSQTLSVKDANMKGYNLSITTRACGDAREVMEEITYRTIKAWLWIADRLEQQVYDLPLDPETGNFMASVEERCLIEKRVADPEFNLAEAWGDSRCTVWNTYRSQLRTDFHLDSDDIPQVAVDTWLANNRAIERVLAETPQNAVKPAQDAPPASATPPQGSNSPATTKASNAPVGGAPAVYTKKQAIETLQPGDKFKMKIVQIEKHSKDGADFYDFYEPYGGKAGQYSSTSIFVDNEIALNNGLIAYLETMGIKLGQALTGNWVLNCSVGKPKTKTVKGEEKTFTNIYVNSFEGQPETV